MVFLATAGLVVTVVPQVVTAAAAAPTSMFTSYYKAGPGLAQGTPTPASGGEAILPQAGSWASVVVSGSGEVVLGARGTACPDQLPEVEVAVDGVAVGRATLTTVTTYASYTLGSSIPNGSHTIKVTMLTDEYIPHSCDVNAYLATVSMKAETPAAPPAGGKPAASNTGVPDGTALTVHNGDLTVTQAGTVIDALDIKGGLYIKADNVTVTRSLIEGGEPSATPLALVAAWWGARNFVITDSTLKAQHPNLMIDGLSGSGITASRLDISGVVDTAKVIGPNFTLKDSWLHNNLHSDNDPNQASHTTHDDSVQVEGGSNILLEHNTMENGHNSAVMVTQNHSVTANLTIKDNWLSGGACQINVTQRAQGGPIQGMNIQDNRFGPGGYGTTCPMLIPSTSPVSITGNVWDATGKPAVARLF